MKEVIAIIRMNKIQATKDVLAEAGYTCLTATLVYGRMVAANRRDST